MLASAFRSAIESHDHQGMVAALAPDCVLHSPVTFKPFEGRDAVAILFGVLLQVFQDFEYTDHLEQGNVAILVFKTSVGDKLVEGIDLLRFGDDGLIQDFTVMVRPLSATMALAEAVGSRLQSSGS